MEKVNRRTLTHLSTFGEDLSELGARYNAFALSEQSQTLAAAIERIGQSVDSTYLKTAELSSSLSAGFAEPMRESAQFAGVVRSVLRYRVLKRIQQEMTKDELEKKRALLESLERSEMEARRIEQYLNNTGGAPASPPRRAISSPSRVGRDRSTRDDDDASFDSDFPPTHGDTPSANQGAPQTDTRPPNHRKTTSSSGGNFVTNKIFGRLSHAIHGVVDVDPERTRRDQIGKTKETLSQVSILKLLNRSSLAVPANRWTSSSKPSKCQSRMSRMPVPVSSRISSASRAKRRWTSSGIWSPSPSATSTGPKPIRLPGKTPKPKWSRLSFTRRLVHPLRVSP
jgi:sorting nexin-41/42